MGDIHDRPDLPALARQHYAEGDATLKGPSYLREYERVFSGRRDEELRILELGVSSGASLLMWRDYFPRATIVGLDIDELPQKLAKQDRVHLIRASQDDIGALDEAVRVAGDRFDLIIDDASHIGYLTKRSFLHLFPKCLKPGGTYVIEDLGTSFLPEYPDGRAFTPPSSIDADPATKIFASHQHGLIGVVKQLIDHTMQELMTGERSYLAVERIDIMMNIAFITKSHQPAGVMPSAAQVAANATATAAVSDEIANELTELRARVDALEGVLGHFFTQLRFLRKPWRYLTGRKHDPST